MKKLYMLSVCLLMVVGAIKAQLIIYEPFNYTVGTTAPDPDAGLNSGNGLPATNVGGNPTGTSTGIRGQYASTLSVVNGLTYSGLQTTGGAANFTSVSGAWGADMNVYKSMTTDPFIDYRIGASTTGNFGKENQTLFISFLAQTNTSTAASFRMKFSFSTNVYIENTSTTWSLNYNAEGARPSTASLQTNTPTLLVIKIKFGTGTNVDSINLYKNPPIGGNLPSTPDAVLTNKNIGGIVSYNTRPATATSGTMTLDELRMGLSYADVTPSNKPSAPTITGITPGNTSLSVAFTAPGNNGGSAITDYKYSTDGGSNWTSAGTTSSPISITGLSNGVSYNVQLRAVNANGDGTATASTSATTSAVSGAVTASSLNLTPSSAVQVASGAALTIDNNQSFGSITVAQGGKLTISNAPTLSGSVTLESNENGTATLIDDYTTPTISATVKQYVTAGRNWYLSPSVSAAGYGWLSRGTSVQEWNEATKAWVIKSSGTLTPGKGYVQVATSTPSVTGTTGTVNVTGTTNSGNVSVTVTRTESGSSRGFNLVGNPYPSYLNWDAFYAESANAAALLNSFWFRSQNNSNQYVFTTYNGASHTVVGGTTVLTDLNNYIPPMQAFWVRVKQNLNTGDSNYPHNSASITFKNIMRGHIDAVGNTLNNKFKAPKADERRSLRLLLANGSQTDESLIYFDAAAANTFDDYDSPKMLNNSSSMPDLYSLAGTERLAINGLTEVADNMVLPLGFTLKTAATGLKLKVSELSNFAAGTKVYLMDSEQNAQTELMPETEYTFDVNASTTNNESRFSLLFRAPGVATGGVENTTKPNVQVYVNAANQLVISAPVNSMYTIYNAMGQQIENGKINMERETRNTKLNTGVYVVKVGNESKRVIIK